MKIGHHKPTFSFKPRSSIINTKDYDVIITDILNQSKQSFVSESEDNNKKSVIQSPFPLQSKTFTKRTKSITPKSECHEGIGVTITTTKYVTAYHRSYFIPTVVAVFSDKKQGPRFERKSTLSEKRNKQLIAKTRTNSNSSLDPTPRPQHNSQVEFNKLTEQLKDITIDLNNNEPEDLNGSVNLFKSSSNHTLLNQIRSKVKKSSSKL